MKKILLSIITLLAINLGVNAQDFEWAKSMGGTNTDISKSLAVDAVGNVYTTGYFKGTADFDPGTGTNNLISNGDYDLFIQKLDSLGNLVWAKSLGGAGEVFGQSLALDTVGNIYITGSFEGTVDFNAGIGTNNLTSNGGHDVFILKLNNLGDFVWAKSVGGVGPIYTRSIALDAARNVYIAGVFEGTADFNSGSGVNNLTSNGDLDIFIQKLDMAGNFEWAKSMGGSGYDNVTSIAVNASGNVYTTGNFEGTVDFNPGTGNDSLISKALRDIFIQKLDVTGNFEWAKSMGGNRYERGNAIAVDAVGNIYTTGYFAETVDFNPGAGTYNLTSIYGGFNETYDLYIQKLDVTGNFEWAKSFGAAGNDYGNAIALDAAGNLYITGEFEATVDFNPGTGSDSLTSNGSQDVFIQKLDPAGNFVWAKSLGSTSNDGVKSIAVDDSGNVYTTGEFQNTINLSLETGNHSLISNGGNDVFILKMSQKQTTPATEIKDFSFQNLSIYPNPTNGIINLNVSEKLSTIKIMDLTGKTIKEFNADERQLDISAFTTGIYFLEIANSERKSVVKIMKK